jgi:hypothetical protein
MEMERKPGGRHRGANFVSPSGLMLRDPTYPSAYADGSSCFALRATEESKKCNFKTRERGTAAHPSPQAPGGVLAVWTQAQECGINDYTIDHQVGWRRLFSPAQGLIAWNPNLFAMRASDRLNCTATFEGRSRR